MRPPVNAPPPAAPSGAVLRQLASLAWPVVGINVLTVLSLAVDTAMVGHTPLAEAALTGMGFATQVVFLLMVAMMGVTVGSVAFVARAHGAGDRSRVDEVVAQSATLAVLLGVSVAVLGNLLATPGLRLLGAHGDDLEQGLRYLRPLLLGSPFYYLGILLTAVCRGVGNTRLPFLVSAVANALNVVVNYALIMGHWGAPALGTLGAAIGTVISQVFTVIALTALLSRGAVPGLRVRPRLVVPRWAHVRDLLRVGAPAAADLVVVNAGLLSIIGMLGRIDPLAVAAHGVGLRVQSLAFVPGIGISQAIGAMVGQALGARDPERARQVLRAGVGLCVGVMGLIAVPLLVAGPSLVGLFDVDPQGALGRYALQWMRLLGWSMPAMGVYVAFIGLFQGSGATRLSLSINALITLVFQIPLSWALGFPFGLGAFGVWLALPLGHAAKGLLAIWVYRQGGWARVGGRV